MISSKRARDIMFEMDNEKRNKLVDKLTEEDAKLLLKHLFTVMRERTIPDFTATGYENNE